MPFHFIAFYEENQGTMLASVLSQRKNGNYLFIIHKTPIKKVLCQV